METLMKIIKIACDIGFVVLPLVGYIHQYVKIIKLKNSEGFSKLVSFILIFAFDIRIFFWVGDRFELAVLLNAVIGLIMQLILLHACVKYSGNNQNKTNSDYFSLKEFWNWPYFMDYFYFISLFTITLSLISNIIGYTNQVYIVLLGVLTAIIEALLGVPQMVEIFKTKNVGTISYLLVGSWFCGDVFKLLYYIKVQAPIQLLCCDVFQLIVDIIIIGQLWYYSKYGGSSTKPQRNLQEKLAKTLDI